jgi:CHAT domain-containing protein
LSQLPFALLTTEPFQLSGEKEVLFSEYRNAPWMINRISITMVPSISSFLALRGRAGTIQAKKAFAGFGDPIFNQIQLAQTSNDTKLHSSMATTGKAKLDIRGIRLTSDGSLDNQKLTSCTLEMLERLPDTADELLSIAETLGANPAYDVYLGPRATEKQVKSMDLSDRGVVAFASHALVPYDLDGLDQPAIALSAPSVTKDDDDGLLTMSEIMELKLNADWVVLSACNTGAADGAGAEAASGLGRAFFYAGTRSLLVSMWPVETTSARRLTTSLFRHLKNNPCLTKAQAHQKAMLELIEGAGRLDEDRRAVESYAHPFFWAPFVIVGDNGIINPN